MQEFACEHNVDCMFNAKCISQQIFMVGKQTVNGKLYKAVIKKLIARVHGARSELQESYFWYLLHDNASGNLLSVVS
jgi:hypothetical protein